MMLENDYVNMGSDNESLMGIKCGNEGMIEMCIRDSS